MLHFLSSYKHFMFYGGLIQPSPYLGVLTILGGMVVIGYTVYSCIYLSDNLWGREDFDKVLRIGSVILVSLLLWPWVVLLAAPCIVCAFLWFVVRAWLSLVPNKEARVKKAERRLATARGNLSNARSN